MKGVDVFDCSRSSLISIKVEIYKNTGQVPSNRFTSMETIYFFQADCYSQTD